MTRCANETDDCEELTTRPWTYTSYDSLCFSKIRTGLFVLIPDAGTLIALPQKRLQYLYNWSAWMEIPARLAFTCRFGFDFTIG